MGMAFGLSIQQSLAENPVLLDLVCALKPRDVAEIMLIAQFVVLHIKGMKSFYTDSDEMGVQFLRLANETFGLLNRYRGKASSQNINVTYNIVSNQAETHTICTRGL